tara:strand:+ start:819 stop:1415 length:597 start_codon:yes stop_codon:yes gene_type:complete
MNSLHNYKTIAALDFRNNRGQLIMSYVIRGAGVLIFGYLLHTYVLSMHENVSFRQLISIELPGIPSWVSILLLTANIMGVLYLHELIHAIVFYLTHGQLPHIGWRGWTIFASAPEHVLSGRSLIINALAPFTIISAVGVILLGYVPLTHSPWVFIPTLVNAAASGGDFMAVWFVARQKRGTRFNDQGDVIYALEAKKE